MNLHPANPNDSTTDLHRSALIGDLAAVRDALAAGINVETTDARGHTPLAAAVLGEQADAIRLLLAAGADPYRAGPKCLSPLLLATNSLASLRAFRDAGVDLDRAAGRRQITPLMYAARHGFADVVRFLLATGADPERTDDEGRTARDHAAAFRHRPVARLLRAAAARTVLT